MNKVSRMMLVLPAMLAATVNYVKTPFMMDAPRGSTPGMPHGKRHHRDRAKPPNDGRWHMKFHRSRA